MQAIPFHLHLLPLFIKVWIRKFLDFILFGSIFIACCAVSLCIATNILLDLPLNNLGFYCFVFGATLVQYNLHYVSKTEAVKKSLRLAWSQRNKQIHFLLLGTGIALIIISFFTFQPRHYIILTGLAAIAFLYSFPFIPFAKKKRLKEYGLLKILTLSLFWTMVTVWFPVCNMNYTVSLFWFVFAERFVFMFVLCLLFDVRDYELDAVKGIKTVPVIVGKQKSYWLAYGLLFLFIIICGLHDIYFPDKSFLIASLISAAATFITIEVTKKNHSDIIFLAGIDGMMLLQSLLIFLFSLKL